MEKQRKKRLEFTFSEEQALYVHFSFSREMYCWYCITLCRKAEEGLHKRTKKHFQTVRLACSPPSSPTPPPNKPKQKTPSPTPQDSVKPSKPALLLLRGLFYTSFAYCLPWYHLSFIFPYLEIKQPIFSLAHLKVKRK